MAKIRYINNELQNQRLLQRKIKQWEDLEFVPSTLSEAFSKDNRWSAKLVIRPLLFMTTSIMLLGAIILILFTDSDITPYILFFIGLGILFTYECFIGKRYYKSGIDESFIITGTGVLILAVQLIFIEDIDEKHPIQCLIFAAIAWLSGVRYQNYIVYYASFILFIIFLALGIKYLNSDYLIFPILSVLFSILGWIYFNKKKKNSSVLNYRWNETLEVFFMAMVAVTLNPYYQNWAYHVLFLDGEQETTYNIFSGLGFVLLLLINLCFVGALAVLGVKRKNRAALIVAISSVYTSFLSVWWFYGEDWPVNIVLTFCGISIFGFGLLLNHFFRKKRWNILATKLNYQEEDHGIFDIISWFREKINLKR